MSSCIESIGIKLPETKVDNKSLIGGLGISAQIKLELITGIKERRFCSPEEDALTLAVDATNDCLRHSSIEASAIDMIIYCGISRLTKGLTYHYEPSISSMLKEAIGASEAMNFDISNACAGMLTGIHIADTYIQLGYIQKCLVVSGEYISSIAKNAAQNIDVSTSPELASLTVGDAGAAVILEKTNPENGFELLELKTFSQYSKLCTAKLSPKYPGAQMFTQMQKLHQVSLDISPSFVDKCLSAVGLSYADMDFVVPHQTAKRAISAGSRKYKAYFGTEGGEVVYNLEKTGNTASTTHFIALYRLLSEQKLKKDDRILLLGFASGLVMGLVVFKPYALVEKYGN